MSTPLVAMLENSTDQYTFKQQEYDLLVDILEEVDFLFTRGLLLENCSHGRFHDIVKLAYKEEST